MEQALQEMEAWPSDRLPLCGPGVQADRTLVSLMDGAWIELAIDSDSDTPEASSLAYVHVVVGD